VTGWEAMQREEFGPAAAAFARAIALSPDGALVEDSTYWRAVAIARLGRVAEATASFRGFIDAFPRSTRAGEASVMLGWVLVETGEREEARRRFEAALTDPSSSVRTSAREGLDALDRPPPAP